jgi:hypothetical protein
MRAKVFQKGSCTLLSDLFKLSLVEYQEATGRYHLHDLARDFAASRLDESIQIEAH